MLLRPGCIYRSEVICAPCVCIVPGPYFMPTAEVAFGARGAGFQRNDHWLPGGALLVDTIGPHPFPSGGRSAGFHARQGLHYTSSRSSDQNPGGVSHNGESPVMSLTNGMIFGPQPTEKTTRCSECPSVRQKWFNEKRSSIQRKRRDIAMPRTSCSFSTLLHRFGFFFAILLRKFSLLNEIRARVSMFRSISR